MRNSVFLALGLVLLVNGVQVTINAGQNLKDISPLIYGMNFASDSHLQSGVTLNRWGGNSVTRYNYKIDVQNTANDYFYENLPGCWNSDENYCANPPVDPQATSGSNKFITSNNKNNAVSLITLPTMGFVAKTAKYSHPFDCGCPRSSDGSQDSYDPFDTNCGDGKHGGAQTATCNCAAISTAIDSTWTTDWVTYLKNTFGPSNGKRIYALDNEPNLWSSTHYDCHKTPTTYDELWNKMLAHSTAALAADPTALISGPAEWGWPNYFCSALDTVPNTCSASSVDRAAHGGVDLTSYLLTQAKNHEISTGKRILHYLDLHYYPQGGSPPDNIQSLYNPLYKDPSWIDDFITMIPRMKDWVDKNYPGTKTMLSEYSWYMTNTPQAMGVLTEVLGIFGREGLDAATMWDAPKATEIGFNAFLLYRNYDGKGSAFGNVSVSTQVSLGVDQTGIRAFGAVGPNCLTIVIVNHGANAENVDISYANFNAKTTFVNVFKGNSGNAGVTQAASIPLKGTSFSYLAPANSAQILVIGGDAPFVHGNAGIIKSSLAVVFAFVFILVLF